jgi:hypothetical protein
MAEAMNGWEWLRQHFGEVTTGATEGGSDRCSKPPTAIAQTCQMATGLWTVVGDIAVRITIPCETRSVYGT